MSAPSPFPQSGFVVVGSNQVAIPFDFFYASQGKVYYHVYWPTETLGDLKMVLGVSTSGVKTASQAQDAIQKVADNAPVWKIQPVPLPY